MKRPGHTRSYVLALCPNPGKAEMARYAIWWSTRFCLDYVRRLYWLPDRARFETTGFGKLNHGAQERARGMLCAGRAHQKATGERYTCPQTVAECADAEISRARRAGRFSLWVKPRKGPYIPALPHRAFTAALRRGAKLRPYCEIRIGKRGGLVAHVFVEYPRKPRDWTPDVIAADVGINTAVATSDGRLSASLWPLLRKAQRKHSERKKQGHLRPSGKTPTKQLLDREARRLVTLAAPTGRTIAVESLKTIGHLKPSGKKGGWAQSHFAKRVRQIAEESGVPVIEVHAAYTSTTCPECDHAHFKNRRAARFQCQRCGFRGNADTVAARNIARKARRAVRTRRRKGDVKLGLMEMPTDVGEHFVRSPWLDELQLAVEGVNGG